LLPFDTSHGILAGPLAGSGFVTGAVLLVEMGNLRDERIVGIGVRQHAADAEEDLADCQGRTPLVLQNVEADTAIAVDVGVVDARREAHLGRLEWVVRREVNCEEKDASRVGAIARTHDGRLPVEQVLATWSGTAGCRGVPAEVLQLLCDSLEGHLSLQQSTVRDGVRLYLSVSALSLITSDTKMRCLQ
jgi:hypothetical protein